MNVIYMSHIDEKSYMNANHTRKALVVLASPFTFDKLKFQNEFHSF